MTEECLAEEARLLERTIALQTRTQELGAPQRTYLQSEHDELQAQLKVHKSDLAAFQARCLEQGAE